MSGCRKPVGPLGCQHCIEWITERTSRAATPPADPRAVLEWSATERSVPERSAAARSSAPWRPNRGPGQRDSGGPSPPVCRWPRRGDRSRVRRQAGSGRSSPHRARHGSARPARDQPTPPPTTRGSASSSPPSPASAMARFFGVWNGCQSRSWANRRTCPVSSAILGSLVTLATYARASRRAATGLSTARGRCSTRDVTRLSGAARCGRRVSTSGPVKGLLSSA